MAFTNKGKKPSILVMSATPIPRTLSLAAYGDMDESKIIEKPIGRLHITTTSLSRMKFAEGLLSKQEFNIVMRTKNNSLKYLITIRPF